MIVHPADGAARPWKNGLGRTREIAVHPAAASGDDFSWRVSIAEVDSAAPFSVFPGIDRQIVLLDGAGFHMTLDDGRTHALTTPFEPFAFPGEAAVRVALVDGPTRDFNLMVRRSQAHGTVQVWRGAEPFAADPAIALVYCGHGAIETVEGTLLAGDAWRPPEAAVDPPRLHEDALGLVVRITRITP